MLFLPALATLFSLLTNRLLQHILQRRFFTRNAPAALPVRINPPAITAQQSFENNTDKIQAAKQRFTVRQRQQRALQDFFRDTGGRVTDLRVLRSAMYLSDEIDRAVRGIDVENQYVGWRPYNRFYAEGTEELFTNIPTGRSPLVMAAPKTSQDGSEASSETKNLDDLAPVLPIQYQAVRQSHLKQVGRAISEIETYERDRLSNRRQDNESSKRSGVDNAFEVQERPGIVKPANESAVLEQQRLSSADLKAGLFQAYRDEPGAAENKRSTIKRQLLRFEGEISEKNPDLDYKFSDFD